VAVCAPGCGHGDGGRGCCVVGAVDDHW
jgi:hypothetical protein